MRSQCERRGKECIFLPLAHTKRTSATRRTDLEDDSSQHREWRGNKDDSQSDGGVFALDGDDDMDVPGSYKKRKRKLTVAAQNYMDMDTTTEKDGPGRFALPAAAALLSAAAASANSSINHPVMLGNGTGGGLKHNLSDQALDASAALSQLSSASPASSGTAGFSFGNGAGYSLSTAEALLNSHAPTAGSQSTAPPVKMATSAWLSAYTQGVSPFTSQGSFSPLDAVELQRVLNMNKEQLEQLQPDILARALMDCAKMAHGSRYTGNLDTSAQHAWKSWTLVKVCTGKKRVHTLPQLAQSLVSSLELLAYYFIGTSDFYKQRVVVQHMYHIYMTHKPYIADSTAHRVLGFMIGASCCLDDIEFYLAKAKALNLQATTPYETSGWVVLSLMLASTIIGTGDREALPQRSKSLSDREAKHKIAVLHVIEESEKAVSFYEATPSGMTEPNSQKVCRIHRLVLEGCRALVQWQCGYDNEAIEHAKRVLTGLPPCEVSRLPHLISLSYCTQVARCTNQRALYKQGLELLSEGIDFYAYIRMMYTELKKPPTALEVTGSDDSQSEEGSGMSMTAPNMSLTNPGLSNAPLGLFKGSGTSMFARTGSSGFGNSKIGSASGTSSPISGIRNLSVSSPVAPQLSSMSGSSSATTLSPRTEDESGMNTITPMRPNPMKVSLFARSNASSHGAAGQSVSPQTMQSVSPSGMQSVSPHHFQGISPHLGVSPLGQGLSPFTALSTPLIQPHLVPPQFSPQISSFLNVGAFSPGGMQSTSPSWNSTPNLNSEYLMDSAEPSQPWP